MPAGESGFARRRAGVARDVACHGAAKRCGRPSRESSRVTFGLAASNARGETVQALRAADASPAATVACPSVSATDARHYGAMDDLFIPLWPPAWVKDYTLIDEQIVAAAEDVKLMSAVRSDQRVLLSVSWPGGRRYLMIDPAGSALPEALRAGAVSADTDLARSIDAMWSQALTLAKQILDGELPALDEQPRKRRGWRRRG